MRTVRKSFGTTRVSLMDDFHDIISEFIPSLANDGEDDRVRAWLDGKDCTKMEEKLVEIVGKHLEDVTE
jgi:hypothetical protein